MAVGQQTWAVNAGWKILLEDLKINSGNVLRRAALPEDLFGRDDARLTSEEYFRLWQGLDEEAADPALPLRLGRAISVEAFDPPIFAALCSPNLNVALQRIAQYKRLICPLVLHIESGPEGTRVEFEWPQPELERPNSMIAVELVFFVQLARIATRAHVEPLASWSSVPLVEAHRYTEYFGSEVRDGSRAALLFSHADAQRTFLTANEKMWLFFERDLQKRLAELDASATTAERTRAALLELLPSGGATMNAVARKLGTSSRTLQRRLKADGESFQGLLNDTRESLARHYLRHSRMSGAEISFLLGFEDPNSFFRAFHSWTGQTPEQARTAMVEVPAH